MTAPTPAPRVSVLLPTYNRAAFLPAAFDALRAQTWTDWQLVIVDDGSADNTRELVTAAASTFRQPVTYVSQTNAGPYAARNRALELATGEYVAFYDSDDIWLPHHLERSARALDDNADVDWVYGACRMVAYPSGRVLDPDTFTIGGQPRPFRSLRVSTRGPLAVFDDPHTVTCAIESGLYGGLQNSVIRRRVFANRRFHDDYRNEAEDQLFLIRALKHGHRVGYLNDVHVIYNVHDANSSGSSTSGRTLERQAALLEPLIRGFEELRRSLPFTASEERALRRRLAGDYFWRLGYATYWLHGRRSDALRAFRRGLRLWPWSGRCWKTYVAAWAGLSRPSRA